MIFLRCYLLVGLATHKIVWEVLKRRQSGAGAEKRPNRSIRLTFVKAIKIGILISIVIQTFLEDVLPITQEPLILRIAGATVYTAGLLLAIIARIQLGANWTDIENGQVLSDHIIVSNGLYRYIRHPIYIGDLLLLIGFELSLNSWLIVLVGLMVPVVLWKATHEERIVIKNLPGYAEYCRTTKRFIPFVI